jgi:hypothetical protein
MARHRNHEVPPGIANKPLNLAFIRHDDFGASTSLPHSGVWRYGETIRDVGRREHVSAGRPSE